MTEKKLQKYDLETGETIMNILMIEDNQSVSEMMQMFFLNEGWEATFKYDGKEGLKLPFRKPTTLGYDYTRPELPHWTVC